MFEKQAIAICHPDLAKEYFAPTPEWNEERAWDRLWSRAPLVSGSEAQGHL
jgi:hypothetical protein